MLPPLHHNSFSRNSNLSLISLELAPSEMTPQAADLVILRIEISSWFVIELINKVKTVMFERRCISYETTQSQHTGHMGITCKNYFIPSMVGYTTQDLSRYCVTLNTTFRFSCSWEESHDRRNKYREISNSNRCYATELD